MLRELEACLPSARLISLDHDLDPEEGEETDPGTGWDVTKALAAMAPVCPVIIHTSNRERSDWMMGEFELGGWEAHRVAPIGGDWIEHDWAHTVRRLLRRGAHSRKRGPRIDAVIEPMMPGDWDGVRAIYLEGIATGQATFETEAPSWEQWDAGHLPFGRLVARSGGRVAGWAALSPVSRRRCYAGVAEVSVYVGTDFRGRGVGRALLAALIAEAERQGIWTLQGSTFPENVASLRLQESLGFRIVGRRERIAMMNGVWRDTVLTERRSTAASVQ